MSIRLLRLRRPSALLTAQVYEELFDRELGHHFDVTVADSAAFCDTVLGADAASGIASTAQHQLFRRLTAAVDFICPNFECAPLAPALIALRNAAQAPVRLLFISHATGSYAPEWSLLAPLLRTGDVIVTPSEDARRMALALHAGLRAFVHVVHHPMAPLIPQPRAVSPRRPHLVSLGRVHAQKLIHRQIDALAVLRDRGETTPTMDIGGPLDDAGWKGAHPYTRGLQQRITRLRLDDSVRLVGAIRGAAHKANFLARADVVCNLSVTIEESFPKTPVEALGLGVPVLGTVWTGLRETVGACGLLPPVTLSDEVMGGADVDALTVANGITAILNARPDPASCRAHVDQFTPARMLARYQRVLEDALDARDSADRHDIELPATTLPAAPDEGILGTAAPLTGMAWREWFNAYLPWTWRLREAWHGRMPAAPSWGDDIRRLLAVSIQPALERIAAGAGPLPKPAIGIHGSGERVESDETVRVCGDTMSDERALRTALLSPRTSPAGRLAAASALVPRGVRMIDAAMHRCELSQRETSFWRAEAALAAGLTMPALADALAAVRYTPPGENDWPYVRMVARAARRAGVPEAAIPTLQDWLCRYPDAQESGPVWLELAVCLLRGHAVSGAGVALSRARVLLGDIPSVVKCAASIEVACRHEVLV